MKGTSPNSGVVERAEGGMDPRAVQTRTVSCEQFRVMGESGVNRSFTAVNNKVANKLQEHIQMPPVFTHFYCLRKRPSERRI